MSFHLGKPILVMILLAAAGGGAILLRPGVKPRADLVVWVFADSHARTYRGDGKPSTQPSLIQQFHGSTGKSVDIQLISGRAEIVRLESIFMSDIRGPEVPDVVEIEIGQVGKFFRPPLGDVGLLPLNDYLRKSAWLDKVVASRFAPWSKEGVIFGVPHDVHPVTIMYRDDLFREAGIELSEAKTWPQFHKLCLEFQRYWTAHGRPDRHAIELASATSDVLVMMLLQRHVNLIDDFNRLYMTDPRVAQTVAFYSQLVAGAGRIGAESSGGAGAFGRDANEGNICAFVTPDWRVDFIKEFSGTDTRGVPILQGKMRMMPLPVFEPGDAPTSTWGGTMMGIPKACRDPDAAWKLIEFLYFSREGIEARRRETQILPPVITMWNDPIYERPDPYFGGQRVDKLYVELAPQIPARYVTPATGLATATLSWVLHQATGYVETAGSGGLEERCQQWLAQGQSDLQRRIEHGKFE